MMPSLLHYFSFQAPHKRQAVFLLSAISLLYLLNFHVNDIWTPNESFYAEAVREMFESGNFLEIYYNYEPRYNKPPLTYWVIAGSVALFGMNEFAIRLPIVLMALGSIWLTYRLGKQLYGDKGGLYAMVMMALSLQLLAVKQYASPEIPLTFFFTLTLHWFLKGYTRKRFGFILLSYVALGLTVLTKGYPYLIIIGGIIGLFLLWESSFNLKKFGAEIGRLKLHIGIPIVVLIGLSWVIYMYLKDGQDFWTVYRRETFERALTRETNGLRPFFYWEVIAWSLVPYSLVFYYALIRWIRDRKKLKAIAFPLCWFAVMLVIFTLARGKIPTYMIQAHPAMVLMIVPLLLNYNPENAFWKVLWRAMFLIPALAIIGLSAFAVVRFGLGYGFFILPALALLLLGRFWREKQPDLKRGLLTGLPFWSLFGFLVLFALYLPQMEQFRPYDEIGHIITARKIGPDIPLRIQGTLIHNIPFYAKRRVIRDVTPEAIDHLQGPSLALVREEDLDGLTGYESLWSGWIYDFSSESQFAKFIIACLEAEKGNYAAFAHYHLVSRGIP